MDMVGNISGDDGGDKIFRSVICRGITFGISEGLVEIRVEEKPVLDNSGRGDRRLLVCKKLDISRKPDISGDDVIMARGSGF